MIYKMDEKEQGLSSEERDKIFIEFSEKLDNIVKELRAKHNIEFKMDMKLDLLRIPKDKRLVRVKIDGKADDVEKANKKIDVTIKSINEIIPGLCKFCCSNRISKIGYCEDCGGHNPELDRGGKNE